MEFGARSRLPRDGDKLLLKRPQRACRGGGLLPHANHLLFDVDDVRWRGGGGGGGQKLKREGEHLGAAFLLKTGKVPGGLEGLHPAALPRGSAGDGSILVLRLRSCDPAGKGACPGDGESLTVAALG